MIHYTSQLAKSLSKKNEVAVILPKQADRQYFSDNIKLVPIDAPANIFKTAVLTLNPFISYKLYNFIRNYRPDVIHIVNTHPWNVMLMATSLGTKGIKKVYTVHDPVPHEQNIGKEIIQPVYTLTDYLSGKWADNIVVHGKVLKKDCIDKGVAPQKIRVIPLGDLSFFNKKAETQNHLKLDGKGAVLFFGRIEEYKGIEYFIKAALLVNKTLPEANFIIAGDGDFNAYKKLVSGKPFIQVLNRYISDDEVCELFTSASIVVLPYISATQSGIIPIAYAFKKPVIATNTGAIPEVVDHGKTGILIEPRDVEALADNIVNLLKNDKLRNDMGENAYNKMLNELSWDKISELTLTVYSSI